MPRSVRLRPWQLQALECFRQHPQPDFLTVATPGAGKTTFALTAALADLSERGSRRVLVVAPTQHLKVQWARAASALGLHLDPAWSAREGRLPGDMHGVIVTYQQVAANPGALRPLARDAFVIFDEIHHAGDERAWGDGVREAFELAGKRLSLSGTPFRSDTHAIPFVRYNSGQAEPDFEYGYGDALEEGGVVRPAFFPRINGEMEWSAPDGTLRSHTFTDQVDRVTSGQRLRTALSLDGEWLPAVLDQAHQQLMTIRNVQPDAGGLVIAVDQEHARGVAGMLRERHGVGATVAISDDPAASAQIAGFADGSSPWIVAVRMVSEGVDIPRLRVGVFATNTTTELFFRQAVGRLVRWRRGLRRQKAFMFIPDDPLLRTWSVQIGEQRRHSLRKRERDQEATPREGRREEEQMSLFAAISATAIGDPHEVESVFDDRHPEDLVYDEVGDGRLTFTFEPAPMLTGSEDDHGDEQPAATRRERKRHLRTGNAEQAKAIARAAGMTHAQVNRELNRLSGVRTISEATLDQLERRLRHAHHWLRRL
ncbi:MAG: DEAD/DEAH box helicase [Nitriliruptorales bacterium]|nr:DEAD/DEAH box helicase [Nitriliruptorales bacterium]